MSAEIEEKSEMVVKSNRLIEASYKLTMVEQQLVLFAICQARDQNLGLSATAPVSLQVKDFAAMFNVNKAMVYSQLKEATTTLLGRLISINDTHPETGLPRVVQTHWISDVGYVKAAGIVEFTFAPVVIPYITRLGTDFTQYRLGRIGQMSSVHAVRIYELLVQYLQIGTRKFQLQELKKMLGVEHEYEFINDFKKRVIDVAVSQINEHTDLKVAYTQTKTGRTVTGVTFSIKSKTAGLAGPKKPKGPTQTALPLEDPPPKSEAPEVKKEREKLMGAVGDMKKKVGLRVVRTERKST